MNDPFLTSLSCHEKSPPTTKRRLAPMIATFINRIVVSSRSGMNSPTFQCGSSFTRSNMTTGASPPWKWCGVPV